MKRRRETLATRSKRAQRVLTRNVMPTFDTKPVATMLEELHDLSPCAPYIEAFFRNTRYFRHWLSSCRISDPLVDDLLSVERGTDQELFAKYACVWRKRTLAHPVGERGLLRRILRENPGKLDKTILEAWQAEQNAKWNKAENTRLRCFQQAYTCMILGYRQISNVTKTDILVGECRYKYKPDGSFRHACRKTIELTPQRVENGQATDLCGDAYEVFDAAGVFNGYLLRPLDGVLNCHLRSNPNHKYFYSHRASLDVKLVFECHCNTKLELWSGIAAVYRVAEKFRLPKVLTNVLLDWLGAAAFT